MSEQRMTNDKVRREFELVTDGKRPEIDRLHMVTEVFAEMDDNERRAVLAYVADYWGYNDRMHLA
jgi:hypothetical protein